MKTYWLTGRKNDPNNLPRCPFAQLMEQEKLLHAQQEPVQAVIAPEVSASRPIYSPVSFDDLNADGTQKRSPRVTPHQSPAHGAGGSDSRRGSKGLRQSLVGEDGGPAPPGPSVGSQAATMTKPTQAVPPVSYTHLTLPTS